MGGVGALLGFWGNVPGCAGCVLLCWRVCVLVGGVWFVVLCENCIVDASISAAYVTYFFQVVCVVVV